MEQGRREEDTKQDQHHRRLKLEDQPQHQQPQQHQKCPRCESLNTKFCYYNNYSLSQPRYFCKTCRRYWTQGGTLRNVPVGGGCRKGKRPKASSSGGDDSTSQPPAPPPPAAMMSAASPTLRNKEVSNLVLPSAVPTINSYYSGGGFLSSLAAMQSLNNPPHPFHQQPLHVGGQFGGASNLALLQGFSTVPSYNSSRQQIQHQNDQFYQMGNRDKNLEPLYPSDQVLIQPNRPVVAWNQGMVTNTNPQASNANFWSTTTAISAGSNTPAGTSSNQNQWPDLPGYDPPT